MIIDGTIFLALLGFAFFFMLFPSTNHKGAYSIVGMMFFFSLSVISFSGQDITISNSITDGTTTWTSTSYIIQHGDFSIIVFGWIFFLLAMFCLFTSFISFTQSAKQWNSHRANSEM